MKHLATKYTALKCAAVLAVLMAGTAAQATDYNYSETYAPVGKAARTDAQLHVLRRLERAAPAIPHLWQHLLCRYGRIELYPD